MRAITFSIFFTSAHFKVHTAKRYRDSYLIPLPSTLLGMIGAILGVERKELKDLGKKLYLGAKLIDFGGYTFELAKLWKFDNFSNPISTPEKIKILIKPRYTVAVASPDENLISELAKRIRNFNFEFTIYGGNDYHFVEYIGDVNEARVDNTLGVGEGYAPITIIERLDIQEENSTIVQSAYVRGNIREEFIFVWRGRIIIKKDMGNWRDKVYIVKDDKNNILVYYAEDFLSL